MKRNMLNWKGDGCLRWKDGFDFSSWPPRRLVINVKLVTKKMGPLSASVAKSKSPAQKLENAKDS